LRVWGKGNFLCGSDASSRSFCATTVIFIITSLIVERIAPKELYSLRNTFLHICQAVKHP
jgi:hypothetical protein